MQILLVVRTLETNQPKNSLFVSNYMFLGQKIRTDIIFHNCSNFLSLFLKGLIYRVYNKVPHRFNIFCLDDNGDLETKTHSI